MTTQMEDLLIYPDQVTEAVRMLSASSTAGLGASHLAIAKPLEAIRAESLAPLFGTPLKRATLRLDWKIANVVAIHELGWMEDAGKNRPVSPLPVPPRVFEGNPTKQDCGSPDTG
ncbi:hypothetical protein FGIG_06879 [Fasciola gigantica]|uniref:Uncharacterized protein n=1 Tax=Fasciola gigantica TaxID=46835 RepID=A0A504YAD1_FASGI|nr:hypothetical protein FGIG_06879 [Fasciola gigantica]